MQDGSSFYRIVVPSNILGTENVSIQFHPFILNKFKAFPIRIATPIDRINDKIWDRIKLIERNRFVRQSSNFELVWLNRSLLSFNNKADLSIRNVVYDFDDAVWLADARHCFEYYCKNARLILAGNSYLAERAAAYNKNIVVAPTSVDTLVYKKLPTTQNTFNVGWIGSSAGFQYLENMEDELLKFFQKVPDARLVIVSEKYPEKLQKLKAYIDYQPWSRDTDVAHINSFAVGLYPLFDREWDRGKCSLKMLQYMACEVPVIASPIGMNPEIFQHEKSSGKFGTLVHSDKEWSEALFAYYSLSQETRNAQGISGRKIISDFYSARLISNTIKKGLQDLV